MVDQLPPTDTDDPIIDTDDDMPVQDAGPGIDASSQPVDDIPPFPDDAPVESL